MSNYKIITRKNVETGISDEFIMTTGKLISLESTSRETTTNKKKYGFFSAEVDGRISTGIAYDKVVSGRGLKPGDTLQVEILKADALAGLNNRWKVSLGTAEDLGDGIKNFLKGL